MALGVHGRGDVDQQPLLLLGRVVVDREVLQEDGERQCGDGVVGVIVNVLFALALHDGHRAGLDLGAEPFLSKFVRRLGSADCFCNFLGEREDVGLDRRIFDQRISPLVALLRPPHRTRDDEDRPEVHRQPRRRDDQAAESGEPGRQQEDRQEPERDCRRGVEKPPGFVDADQRPDRRQDHQQEDGCKDGPENRFAKLLHQGNNSRLARSVQPPEQKSYRKRRECV
jgi:hypothetical protein